MSEKRFTTNGYYINDTYHDGVKWLVNEVEAKEIVNIMNGLDTKARESRKALSKLQKENERLRQKIGICKDFLQQITLSDDVDGLNVTLWDILMEKDDEEFGEYLKRKAILKEGFK